METVENKSSFRKNVILFILALIVSGISLNFVLFSYFKLPPKISVQAGTAKIWSKNSLIIDRTEGYGTVRTDANGYNNTFIPADVDHYILLMGSSNAQALNVNQNENFAYLLTKKLQNAGLDKYVYNIGFDANDFSADIRHFAAAMQQFQDAEAVIIEIPRLDYSPQELFDSLQSQVTYDPAVGHGNLPIHIDILNLFQAMPLPRLVYGRYKYFQPNLKNAFFASIPIRRKAPELDVSDYQDVFNKIAEIFRQQAGEKPLIILYNPQVFIDTSTDRLFKPSDKQVEAFIKACAINNIYFHDMTNCYTHMLMDDKISPYGFTNSEATSGHINKNGHKAIADELFFVLMNIFGDKK